MRELRRLAVERTVKSSTFSIALASHSRVDFFGGALVVLLAGLELLEHEALHQADHRRAGLGVEHALQVPHDVVGGELPAALAPLHVLAQMQRPGLEVGARLPFLHQSGRVMLSTPVYGEIVERLPRGVRGFDPGIGVRALEILHAHAECAGCRLFSACLCAWPAPADRPCICDGAATPSSVATRRKSRLSSLPSFSSRVASRSTGCSRSVIGTPPNSRRHRLEKWRPATLGTISLASITGRTSVRSSSR